MIVKTLIRRLRILLKPHREFESNEIPFLLPKQVKHLIALVQTYTMIDPLRLSVLHGLACDLATKGVEGDIVECGVCNGGSAAVIAYPFRHEPIRRLWLYDTFEGLPLPSPEDGPFAKEYVGKCIGSIEKVKEVLRNVEFPLEQVVWRKGLFKDTFKQPLPVKVALLHIDADWHHSVQECLEVFHPRVADGGVIVLDDFGHWEGVRKAFYDFCKKHEIYPLLERVGYTQAFWWKGQEHNRGRQEAFKYGIYWFFNK